MSEETKGVLLQVAGFLVLLKDGHVAVAAHARAEAAELLDKIGGLLLPTEGEKR